MRLPNLPFLFLAALVGAALVHAIPTPIVPPRDAALFDGLFPRGSALSIGGPPRITLAECEYLGDYLNAGLGVEEDVTKRRGAYIGYFTGETTLLPKPTGEEFAVLVYVLKGKAERLRRKAEKKSLKSPNQAKEMVKNAQDFEERAKKFDRFVVQPPEEIFFQIRGD